MIALINKQLIPSKHLLRWFRHQSGKMRGKPSRGERASRAEHDDLFYYMGLSLAFGPHNDNFRAGENLRADESACLTISRTCLRIFQKIECFTRSQISAIASVTEDLVNSTTESPSI